MTDLFERLYPGTPDVENIAVHYFFSALMDYAAGHTTRVQIIAHWELDAEAQADLNALCNHIDGLSGLASKMLFGEELHAAMMLAEGGLKYTTKEAFRTRLGLGS